MQTDMLLFECHEYQKSEKGGPGTTDFEAQYELSELGFEVYQGNVFSPTLC